jgi:hypothetical protein
MAEMHESIYKLIESSSDMSDSSEKLRDIINDINYISANNVASTQEVSMSTKNKVHLWDN